METLFVWHSDFPRQLAMLSEAILAFGRRVLQRCFLLKLHLHTVMYRWLPAARTGASAEEMSLSASHRSCSASFSGSAALSPLLRWRHTSLCQLGSSVLSMACTSVNTVSCVALQLCLQLSPPLKFVREVHWQIQTRSVSNQDATQLSGCEETATHHNQDSSFFKAASIVYW